MQTNINLDKIEKEVIQWLVSEFENERLSREFEIIWVQSSAGTDWILSGYDSNDETIPIFSPIIFDSLLESRLLKGEFRYATSGGTHYLRISDLAINLVNNNFTQTSKGLFRSEPDARFVTIRLNIHKLIQIITELFTVDEMRNLALGAGISHGKAVPEKVATDTAARELVEYAMRNGRLIDLLVEVSKEKPHLDLNDVANYEIDGMKE